MSEGGLERLGPDPTGPEFAGSGPAAPQAPKYGRSERVRQAKNFAAVASAHLSAADNEKVHAALSGVTQRPAAAAQLGSLLSEHNAASADAAAAVVPAANPPQAANGQTAAVGLFNWLLHNSYHVPIYYGYCTINGCTTVGNWDFTQTASVFYSSTKGMSYSGEIYYGSGTKATLSGVKVRLYRDVTNSSDTYEASLSCPTSGSSFDCTSEFGTGQGNYAGHWYYLQLDITSNPSGYPTNAFQMQTRRYLVVSNPSDWEFKSYQYYGD